MIPKIIHYCWFGGNPLPELAVVCIESWKKYCPDYEIREWNESNFDIDTNTYTAEAYTVQKWAFITDYVRLYAMVNYGGIYMDTDVEICNNLDQYLDHQAFSGFETDTDIPTGIMACEKGFPLFKQLLDNYKDRHFIRHDGSFDMTTNVYVITKYCLNKGFIPNNSFQIVDGFALYPRDYFCPKDQQSGEITITENTHAIHHFSGSWNTPKELKWKKFERKLCMFPHGKDIINCKLVRLFHLFYISGFKGIKWKINEVKETVINNLFRNCY